MYLRLRKQCSVGTAFLFSTLYLVKPHVRVFASALRIRHDESRQVIVHTIYLARRFWPDGDW